MLIRVINPNTTASMTALIGTSARAVAGPGVTVEAVNPAMGPASIESHYDEALAVPGLLTEIIAGERDGAAGYVVACFGDPGLDAAREVAAGPVIGVAEAAMHAATLVGRGFSVVTTLGRTAGRAHDLARRYTAAGACRGVHACEIPVLNLENDPTVLPRVVALASQALRADGSDVIVLGCAGMAGFCAEVSKRVGVPVIDGVTAATLMVQSLVTLGLGTSKRDEYAPPLSKRYTGRMSDFDRSVSGGSRSGPGC